MFVVLNHAQGYSKWNLKTNEVVEAIGRPLLAEIPFSESVRKALHGSDKKQAVEIDEGGDFAIAIKKLANDLVSAYPEGVNEKDIKRGTFTKGKGKGLFGFLR